MIKALIDIGMLMEDLEGVYCAMEDGREEEAHDMLNNIKLELSLINLPKYLTIKLDTESIVELLLKYSNDWLATLNFIELYAKSEGYNIDREEILRQMRKKLFGD